LRQNVDDKEYRRTPIIAIAITRIPRASDRLRAMEPTLFTLACWRIPYQRAARER
jgi:hypothetical protein